MFRTLRTVARILIIVVVLSGVIAIEMLRPIDRHGQPKIVTIPAGASLAEIGHLLATAGVIRRSTDFVVVMRVRGWGRSLHEGDYQLSPAMGLLEIGDALVRGRVVEYTVTIPEGFTVTEIAETLERDALVDREQFMSLAEDGGAEFQYDFLRGRPVLSLEGYLYPDTYRVPRRLPARKAIRIFLDRFAQVVVARWNAQIEPKFPLHDVITMASLVEREAKVPTEQPLIAGVLYNRLRRGWRLEVDATVLYALGRHKTTVTYEDLKIDSPYNTYRYAGLPPGPIASPGLAAIEAALTPAKTDYLFYVARPDGTHEFSKTFAEHLAAVRRYRIQP